MSRRRLNIHHSFVLVGGVRWYAVIDGEIVSPHPVELGAAYGTAPCVHCQQDCQSYCKSCRKPVCPADFDVHRGDHNPADRTQTWTQTGPHAATSVDAG
jgi:hypothetical protein